MIQIFETTFGGSKLRFESSSVSEIVRWFVERGLLYHPLMFDGGYWLIHDGRQLHGEALEQWIQSRR